MLNTVKCIKFIKQLLYCEITPLVQTLLINLSGVTYHILLHTDAAYFIALEAESSSGNDPTCGTYGRMDVRVIGSTPSIPSLGRGAGASIKIIARVGFLSTC
jgi:hypothetical protein